MPLVSRTFDQLIDFTRTSAATYVDATGKIVPTPASRNLLTFTQEFNNAAWIKSNTTVTSDAAIAPDGTSTADLATQTGIGYVQQQATAGTGTFTASVYLKAGTLTWARLSIYDSAHRDAWFNLATGAVGASGSGVTAAITSAGNGWYRCTVTYATGAPNPFLSLYFTNANSGSALNGTGFIWGAQLEAGTTATDYTRNVGGVYPPRFDYDPVTLAPKGLLVEEQRTNLLVRSEEFDNASWTKTAVSVVANAATSPDGTVDADRLIGGTTATGHILTQVGVASAASGTTYTASVYLKAEGYGFAFVALNGTGYSTPQYISVNLSTGATAIANGTPTAFPAINSGNGWWRVIVTATTDVAAGTVQFDVRPSNDGVWANRNTAQNGTSGIFLYGAQLEADAFATSYIPTVASQVTRTADVATITGANFSQWYNQSEGTMVADWSGPTATTVSALGVVSVSDGTINERVTLRRVNVSNDVGAIIVDNNVVQANLTQAGAASGANKAAIAYRTDDVITAANGTLGPSDTSATMPTVTQLEIGSGPGITYLNGHVRSIRYYPTRLSNAQLQALTA